MIIRSNSAKNGSDWQYRSDPGNKLIVKIGLELLLLLTSCIFQQLSYIKFVMSLHD